MVVWAGAVSTYYSSQDPQATTDTHWLSGVGAVLSLALVGLIHAATFFVLLAVLGATSSALLKVRPNSKP